MPVARITLRWEWMRTALFMSRHWNSNRSCWTGKLSEFCGVKWRRDAQKHVINTSLSVKVYSVPHSLTPCLQISLSSWMKVLYFFNTSCNIPILKPNTSASVFTFLITLSWLLKKDRDCFFIIFSLQAFGSDAFLMIQWKYYCWFRVYLYFSELSEAQQGLLSYTSLCFQLHQDN